MTLREFMSGYRQFLMDAGLTYGSASCYVTYINNACKHLPRVASYNERIAQSDDPREQAVYAELIRIAVLDAMSDPACTIPKDDLNDWRSSASTLVAYISGFEWVKGEGAKALPVIDVNIERERSELIKRDFLPRVRTQDRFSYSYGVLPLRVLNKIATRLKVKLYDKMLGETKFLYAPDKSKFLLLKEIDKLTIATDGKVYMTKDGKDYLVYTEAFRDGKPNGFEIMTATTMADITLDHDTPMVEALEIAMKAMPEFTRLSNDIMRFKSGKKGLTVSKLSTEYSKTEYPKLIIDEDALMKELLPFMNSTALTAMKREYNLSKNKNNA